MKTLEDAWHWYLCTKRQLQRMARLGRRYWDALPWDRELGNDNFFRLLNSADVLAEANASLDHLDDLAIVVLFSVFESIVRDQVAVEVRLESQAITHVALRTAAETAVELIEKGSFDHVLQPYKILVGPNLVEEVSQVRRYRNWVAHGKGRDRPALVDPQTAFERLNAFLRAFMRRPGL